MCALKSFTLQLRALITCAVACALFVTAVQAQAVVTRFASGPPNAKCAFASWMPKLIPDLLQGNTTGEAVNIVCHLFLPPGTDKVPAVVLVHGSGGIYNAELDYWPKQFNSAGVAVFTLDMFGPLGVQSTAEDQSLVPFAADVADSFATLKLLATHPRTGASTRSALRSWGFHAAGPRPFARPSRGSSPPKNCPSGCVMRPTSRPAPAAVPEFSGWW